MDISVTETRYKGVYTIGMENHFIKVVLTNYGAAICSICLPGGDGGPVNVVSGYDDIAGYFTDPFYIGCTVGRVAGRVSNSRFTINSQEFKLPANGGPTGHHLHGGIEGFNKKCFDIVQVRSDKSEAGVEMRYKSIDGEEGYPGNLEVRITYTLTASNELTVSYKARTDKPTHVNLTNHSYFNLTGDKKKALEQELRIHASRILETDDQYIPTGVTKSVENTPYDFTSSHRISRDKGQLPQPGYNDCYLLDRAFDTAAVLSDPESGRKMEVRTSYPALLFYTGDYLKGDFEACEGVCLEAQFFPDAPNRPQFGGTLLLPGQVYDQFISYRFPGVPDKVHGPFK